MNTLTLLVLSVGSDAPVAEVDEVPVADVAPEEPPPADVLPVAEVPETVGTVHYAALRRRVEGGLAARVAIGTPGGPGVIEVKDAPAELAPGLYDVFPEGGAPKIRPVVRETSPPVYRSYAEQLNGN